MSHATQTFIIYQTKVHTEEQQQNLDIDSQHSHAIFKYSELREALETTRHEQTTTVLIFVIEVATNFMRYYKRPAYTTPDTFTNPN